MKKITLICLLLILASSQTWSQNREPLYRGGAFYFEVGLSALDLSEINQILNVDSCDSRGICFPRFPQNFFAFGVGGQALYRKWIFAGTATTYMIGNPSLRANAARQAILNYYYASMKVGYLLYRQERSNYPLLIYPTLGLTGALVQLRTRNSGVVIASKFRDTGYLLDAALNIDYFADIPTSNKFRAKFGLSIGYMLDLNKSMQLTDFVPGRSVPVSLQGPYFRVHFGMGRMRRI